jgi:hypothetical protein
MVIGPLMTSTYPPGVRDSARSLMGFVEDAENRRRASIRDDAPPPRAFSGSRSVPVPGVAPQSARPPDGPPRFTPEFREVQAGEQRFEGTLERIDCAAGRAAVFRTRETGGPAQLETARLGDVDFISYRDDLLGGVTCGILKEPLHVYITWREGEPTKREKTVVAVEFLPKN